MDTYLPSMGVLNDGLRSPSLSPFPANMSVRDVDFAFRGLSARDAYSGRDTKIPIQGGVRDGVRDTGMAAVGRRANSQKGANPTYHLNDSRFEH